MKMYRWMPLLLALMILAAACGDDAGDGDGEEAADSGEVTILHAFTGEEDVAGLNAILDDFRDEYPDITVREEGTGDFESLARTRVGAGNAPDIILHPQPGLLEDFVNEGAPETLDFLDRDAIDDQLVPGLTDLATFNGDLYAIPMRLSFKSIVWYNPNTFDSQGYDIPGTWDEMLALSDQMVADGLAPWCIGIESGDATGWVATDWVEDILLRTIGVEAYDDWVAGDLAFNSDEVRGALEDYLVPIWTNDDYVFGGREQIAREAFGTSITGILGDDPECGLHRNATFMEGFIEEADPDAEYGTDYAFFGLPPIDDDNPALGAGDYAALYTDNPAARTFIEWLATPEAGEAWAERGGYLSPFAPVFDASVYPTDSSREASDALAAATDFRFDGSDLMPGDVGSSSQSGSFWIEMTNWVTGTKELDEALQAIDDLYADVRGD